MIQIAELFRWYRDFPEPSNMTSIQKLKWESERNSDFRTLFFNKNIIIPSTQIIDITPESIKAGITYYRSYDFSDNRAYSEFGVSDRKYANISCSIDFDKAIFLNQLMNLRSGDFISIEGIIKDVNWSIYEDRVDGELFTTIRNLMIHLILVSFNKTTPGSHDMSALDENLRYKRTFDINRCFIATTCFGDYNAPEVIILRNFRDTVLLKSNAGKCVFYIYYLLSPPIAKILSKSEKLKAFVRSKILKPIIKLIEYNNN